MRHRRAAVAQPLHVVVVEPHAVRDGEAVGHQPQLVHVSGERGAVALVAGDHLQLGFGDMGVETDVVVLREVAAGDQEGVAAMVRNGRCEREMDHLERPLLQRLLHLLRGRLPGCELEALDFLLQGRRQAIHEPGDRLEEGEVGHHGRQHAAHADLLVGLGHRRQAFDRGQGELGREIVRCGAALQHHLGSADHCRQIFVLEIAADPPIGSPSAAARATSDRAGPWQGCQAHACARSPIPDEAADALRLSQPHLRAPRIRVAPFRRWCRP